MSREINSVLKKFQLQMRVIKDKNGTILTENEDIKQQWKEYCEDMYKCAEDTGEELEFEHVEDLNSGQPLREEVELAIKEIKVGKSPGCDLTTAEMIKASGEPGIDVYHHTCKKIWHQGKWPQEWKRSIFIPIPKKGDLKECTNYRTISLISHASKIMLKIIQKRLETKLEEVLSATQAGFRKGSGTSDHSFKLRMIIQKCREFNKDLYMCFIDYSKAFDCVSHCQLWATLTQMGFPERERRLIRELYKGQEASIRTNCGVTEWFKIERGVRQRCILLPYLFNIYTEDIMREVGEDGRTVHFNELNIHGHKIRDLRYADDTILLSHDPSGLSHLVESVDKHSSEKCLMLNPKKTKLMKTDESKEDLEIKVDSETF